MRYGGFVALGFLSFGAVIANCSSTPGSVGQTQGYDSGVPGSSSGSTSGSGSGSTTGSSSGKGSSSGSQSSSGAGSGSGSGSSSGTQGSSSGVTGDAGPVLAPNGCPGGHCLNPNCEASTAPGYPLPVNPWNAGYGGPEVGFDDEMGAAGSGNNPNPLYIPADVVIPTLDDVPDGDSSMAGPDGGPDPGYGVGNWTKTDLAYLDSNDMHWDFFINTDNWCGPITGNSAVDDPDCDNDLIDILSRHSANDHTVYHIYMGDSLTPSSTNTGSACTAADVSAGTCDPNGCTVAGGTNSLSCADEITGVITIAQKLAPGPRPYMTRFRAPYGVPFQTGTDVNGTQTGPGTAALTIVGPVVAQFAVEVDWNIDSTDSAYPPGNEVANCAVNPCPTGQSIAGVVMGLLGTANSGTNHGILLMHGVFPWTAAAIPILFGPHGNDGQIQQAGFRVGTVEDAICWKYGMHSWDIVNKLNNYTGANARGPN